ncbi:RDD family protein [Candidatus Poriferisocius sp.]|uniref:RDD family protein n=1 Tax=Candidatus Poriferisocius sp. TaxID=3101276 RepID=UPI003B52DC95
MSNPAWETDPTTRHEYRWWDGDRWTDYVADNGVQTLDPLTGAENLKPPASRAVPTAPDSSSQPDQGSRASLQSQELATRLSRFGARLLDGIIFLAITVLFLFALHLIDVKPMPFDELSDSETADETFEHLRDYSDSIQSVALWLAAIGAIYEIAFIAMKGQTPGKMATRIRVVRADDLFQPEWGRPPTWGSSFGRWALPFLLGLPAWFVPFVGEFLVLLCYLSLVWDRERQGWHDKAARTFVIKKP